MSEINTTTPVTAPAPENPLFALLGNLKEDANGIMGDVISRLRATAKEKLISKKAEQLATALENYSALEKAARSIKPDLTVLDIDGKVTSEGYSKAKVEERKKTQKAVLDAQSAITKALNGDFSQLGNVKAPAAGKAAEPAENEQPG